MSGNIKTRNLPNEHESLKLSDSAAENISLFKKLFENDDTMVFRRLDIPLSEKSVFIMYSDSVVCLKMLEDVIIKPLLRLEKSFSSLEELVKASTFISEISITADVSKIIGCMTYGDTIIFADGESTAAILETREQKSRPLSEPDGEKILSGPREGFSENLQTNISLIRKRLRTNRLKLKYKKFGEISNTDACVCYIDGVASEEVLAELYKRLDTIKIDGALDVNYLSENIRDNPHSILRTTGTTERPDVAVGKLLEGRIIFLLDGTPVALTLPFIFAENFQSSEDYYVNFHYASFARMIRFLSFSLSIFVPALYVAIAAYHQAMLPTPLLINIAAERSSVPLPASLECFILLIIFDILKEAGIRTPANIGQALSIVGALVIGQSAVEAKLVAAPMIIVVALSAITELLIPKLHTSIVFLRLFMLLLSSFFGFYGVIIGFSIIVTTLLRLNSFGVSYFFPIDKGRVEFGNDIYIRSSWRILSSRRKKQKTSIPGKGVRN